MQASERSKSDYIREELLKDFGQDVKKVCATLRTIGVYVNTQSVYAVRSNMRKNPNDLPQLSLGEQILAALSKHQDGLTAKQLAVAVFRNGYVSKAANFAEVLRQKLVIMTREGQLVKNTDTYHLAPVATIKNPVQDSVSAVAVSDTAETASLQAAQDNWDLALLRRAVRDFAERLGVAHPDTFADQLAKIRRDYEIREEETAKASEAAKTAYEETLKQFAKSTN